MKMEKVEVDEFINFSNIGGNVRLSAELGL